MYNNFDYPLGADNKDAPWNALEEPKKDFEITCSQSLSKTVTISTNNYLPGASGVDYIPDGDGNYSPEVWCEPDSTLDTNWENEYHENDYHTPIQLIELFKQFLEEQKSKGMVFKSLRFTDKLIEECKDWVEDETIYVED